MRALRINGRRIPCQTCRRRYAVLAWANTVAVCTQCNRALFLGYMIGRDAEATEINSKYTLTRKEAQE